MVVVALVLILIAVLVATYLARRTLAREALISWLASEGLEADAQFQTLGPEGLVVGLRIGPADAPLLRARRAEVDYRITPPWSDQGLGLTVNRLRLEEPFIRATLAGDGISFGGLDPLIADFRA
ncbi:MAG: C4-dicarboxylate ABC transporter, partial [Caulobacteraceae bacterium]|nr:C4-dicarboxylate ABC transporter [Caulobacteraceae bacterium]